MKDHFLYIRSQSLDSCLTRETFLSASKAYHFDTNKNGSCSLLHRRYALKITDKDLHTSDKAKNNISLFSRQQLPFGKSTKSLVIYDYLQTVGMLSSYFSRYILEILINFIAAPFTYILCDQRILLGRLDLLHIGGRAGCWHHWGRVFNSCGAQGYMLLAMTYRVDSLAAGCVCLGANVAVFAHAAAKQRAGANLIVGLSRCICTACGATCVDVAYIEMKITEINVVNTVETAAKTSGGTRSPGRASRGAEAAVGRVARE